MNFVSVRQFSRIYNVRIQKIFKFFGFVEGKLTLDIELKLQNHVLYMFNLLFAVQSVLVFVLLRVEDEDYGVERVIKQ